MRVGRLRPHPRRRGEPVRIGLIPERDIFRLRKRYKVLAEYLSTKLDRPVTLSTTNTYDGMLRDFGDRKIELAFAGSLVAALAIDRQDARPLLKPELPGGISTYHGVVFVRADSPVTEPRTARGQDRRHAADHHGGEPVSELPDGAAGDSR